MRSTRSGFLRFSFAVSLVAAAFFAAPAHATCSRENVICGPCSQANLVWDYDFSDSSCNAWQTSGSGTQKFPSGATMCSNQGVGARFVGPTNGWSYFYQSTDADAGGSTFSLDYYVEIYDPGNSSSNRVSVEILANGVWTTVDAPAGGNRYCETRSINLGSHPEWVGKTLQIWLGGYAANSSSTVSVQSIALWQTLQ
jgi:hypothetical protein